MSNEPVALMTEYGIKPLYQGALQEGMFLYTHPAKTLTDEEIYEIAMEVQTGFLPQDDTLAFARAILKKGTREMKELDFNNSKYEWLVYRDTDFSVEIKSWGDLDKHHWNVYAYIFDTHPFFNNIDKVFDLHFHGGITYDELIKHSPARGIKYDWQKEYTYLKVGSDYSHLHDDWFATQNPANGIPYEIKLDAEELVEQLLRKAQEK